MCCFHFLFALLLTVFILVFCLAFGVWLFSYLKFEYPSSFSRVVVVPSDFRFSTEVDLKVYGVKHIVLTGCFSFTVVVPSGGYGSNDMAALGATLGVLLCACLAIMAFLIIHIRRDRGDWKKLFEISQFRSTVSLRNSKVEVPESHRDIVGRVWAALSYFGCSQSPDEAFKQHLRSFFPSFLSLICVSPTAE